MKYIKLFEQQWQQPDQGKELLEFSKDSLAYLMDDDFKIIVETSSDVYDAIRIRKGDNPFVPPYNRQSFNWNEIKDAILPYLIRVNRKYDLETVTFYTKDLRGSTSFTKNGGAKIQDLLEEKTIPHYYDWNPSKLGDPRSQVFEEIKVKVKKLPLIYNQNESFDIWSREKKNELKEYCNTNLAYLIDDGFFIRVGQLSSESNHNVQIQITKNIFGDREDFKWYEVKDHLIPFILRLERKYDIEKIRFLGEDNFHYIKDDFEQRLDEQPIGTVSYIDIFLSDEKEQINESLSSKEELKDFCSGYLAYLTDDDFYVHYEEFYGGNATNVEISHSYRNGQGFDFTWDEVKDHFIPFLQMLSKQYRILNFHFDDNKCKRTEVVRFEKGLMAMFKSDGSMTDGNYLYYTYNDIINDNIDFNQGLHHITIKVGRKLNP